MTVKAERQRRKTYAERNREFMTELWGNKLEEYSRWNRTKHDGFSTIPRALPQINRILDALAGTGKPLSQTYTSLWCRTNDEGFINVTDKEILAYEAGFSGQRAVTTWQSRIKLLEDLGFITTKSGTKGDFQYILLLNPFTVIQSIYKTKEKDQRYLALFERMQEVGSKWN
ncbi:hypothetical protein NYR60_07295 [Actinobacillus genomosp. 2]|uniref:hypothetical protein n=1 Tax=Actinobacillus genomosp. 2 TaxID=230709 RepID=UPI0024410820|nr:hypothetical protein [Actinobacillus genomosp. 2]WGE31662.1 hypothetical protein NYR60_07295 [Actinobacillus genomosp. 2]